MTVGARAAAPGTLETEASELAKGHTLHTRPPRRLDALAATGELPAWIELACERLEHAGGRIAEWVLDNRPALLRAVRQVSLDMPVGYYRRLPALATAGASGLPRVYDVARRLAEVSSFQLEAGVITRFVTAYQQHQELKIGELWALPTMLRLLCLETVVCAIVRAVPSLTPPLEREGGAALLADLDDAERVARSVRALDAISAIAWNDLVDATCVVDGVLSWDPARAYALMDFETRDRYRKAVEELADGAARAESDVAREAAQLAHASAPRDPHCHVGHWLIGDGRLELERTLGFRATAGCRMRRSAGRHAFVLYFLALCSTTAAVLAFPLWYLSHHGAAPAMLVAGALLALLPATTVAVALVHWLIARLVPPRVLPKLDFTDGIPRQWRTAVVIPTLLTSRETVRELLDNVERHYLSNPDPQLVFALLTDFSDAATEHVPANEQILTDATKGIRALNEKHGSGSAAGPFHLLHRGSLYNPRENCWMGWERKRGKLEEWNALLRGDPAGFAVHEGDPDELRDVRFVITLDSDTLLPRGAAARLAGTLAHPLNRPQIEADSRRVTSGYTVVQPRIEIDPQSSQQSRFTRLYAGDTAIDIYSRAVSNVYEDLFENGIYVGKGIYDVDAFHHVLEGRVPENALASHDLFEGIHGRVALASDIVLYEGFPPHYLAFAERMHRWIRGDWQLTPWLRARVPAADGRRVRTRFTALGRWMILDNVRRSLISPALLAFLVAGWLVLPGHAAVWTLIAAAAPATHWLCDAFAELWRWRPPGRRQRFRFGPRAPVPAGVSRVVFMLAFLPYEAAVALDAIGRTIARLTITRRHLLEWRTAAQTAARVESRASRAVVWRHMAVSSGAAVAVCAILVWLRPASLAAALPLLGLWLLAPEIAHRISLPARARLERLTRDQRLFVRRLARRTWLFFETLVGPEDHWLPPDNYQEQPTPEIDHRTSPTNVGMLLLSTLSAWDLGYLSPRELVARLHATLSTLPRLERYRGHLLNWYETRTLEPLSPRYVSTVDSGNLAAALVAVSSGCEDAARAPVLSRARWDGLMDALALLEDALARLVAGEQPSAGTPLAARAAAIRRRAAAVRDDPDAWSSAVTDLCETECVDFDKLLVETMQAHDAPLNVPALHEVRIWLERVHEHLRAMQADVEVLLGWLPILDAPPRSAADAAEPMIASLRALLPATLPLTEIHAARARAQAVLAGAPAATTPQASADAQQWFARLDAALASSAEHAAGLCEQFRRSGRAAEAEALTPDFRFLYDPRRNLFHIGYNVSADALDPHHYGLFASECRLASYVAIAKGDVPVKHWFFLGRPMTRAGDSVALLSWGGTMFEYLMPRLLLRSGDDLAGRSDFAVVDAQRAFARRHGVPWGISECAYAAVDAEHTYQYRAFGVPGLGLKRDLSEDLVVAPYACALAVLVRPAAAVENLIDFAARGALGEYGLREALDFTPARVPQGRACSVVASYMAHHQGMVLAALASYTADSPLVRRFHANARMKTVEVLLHERAPSTVALEFPATRTVAKPTPAPRPLYPWTPVRAGAFPELHAFGNGRMTSVISDSGSGGMRWLGRALTRWTPDPTLDDSGFWIYVRDLDSGRLWSVGRQPARVPAGEYEVVFHPHMAELRRRDDGIAIRLEVGVSPGDDVEVRRLTVVNESGRARRLSFTTYAEVVLGQPEDDRQHPAFSKLFVRGEYVAQLDALLFERRARRPGERPPMLAHRLVADSASVCLTRVEMSRERFLGRNGSVHAPAMAGPAFTRSDDAEPDTGLDPIMSIEATVDLAPGATEQLGFVTVVASSRQALLDLAVRHGSTAALEWAFVDAAADSAREAARFDLDPARMPLHQQLLSLVLQPHSALRSPAEDVGANLLSQRDLWSMGLSGDVPILVVTLADPPDTALLRELLGAHRWWSCRGVRVDLVALQAAASGYEDPVARELHGCLEHLNAMSFLHRRGGVHLIGADQVGAARVQLLRAAAHVVLEGERPLAAQLHDAHRRSEPLPLFVPPERMATPAPSAASGRPADLLFDNGIGGFSDGGREYVMHLAGAATTPAPWCNVLANRDFGTLVSERGGGYTWSLNSAERRLTAWRNDPVCDTPSEALYLRDEQTADVWAPMAPSGGAVEIRHAAGYSTWSRSDRGLEQQVEVFVAEHDPVKIVRLRVRDLLGRPRRITATYYAEWVLGTTREQGGALLVSEYDAGARALLARNSWNPVFAQRVAFLASDREPHGFTTDRAEFLGREGDVQRPAALTRWGLSCTRSTRADPCAALQIHLDVEAGGQTEAHFVLGDGADREHALELVARWRDAGAAHGAARAVREHWDRVLGALTVRTPDPAFDVMVNRWLLYQTIASRLFGRTGYYQSSGAFGFRDQLQDAMALIFSEPRTTREHILACARHQFEEGDVLHWWHPPEDRGVRTRCSDDLLWLPFVTAYYVESTGDEAILDEQVPFLSAPPLGRDEDDRYGLFERGSDASLFDHCLRALDRATTRGAHGLPLIGAGDWNDGMSQVGKRGRGESVWLAWFAIATSEAFARICSRRGAAQVAGKLRARAHELSVAAEAQGWDGSWYRRAFDDDGRPWGSAACDECRIDSIAQSWAVLCGAAQPQRARQALDAAERELVRPAERVARLLWPPFDTTPRDPGYIKAYPPGVRENGGQYSHAAAWLAWAFALAGDAERALLLLRILNPIEHARTAEETARYRVEPYVVAGDILTTAPHVGRGGWTWYTGSAAWTYRAAVEAVLGLKLSGGRLEIDPCIPASWPGFEATLRCDGGTIEIEVLNPDGASRGVAELIVDGQMIEGNSIALPQDCGDHSVRVRLGVAQRRSAAR